MVVGGGSAGAAWTHEADAGSSAHEAAAGTHGSPIAEEVHSLVWAFVRSGAPESRRNFVMKSCKPSGEQGADSCARYKCK